MKKLKCRAWDELNKVMHYNFQFIKSGEESNDWIVFTSDKQKLTDKIHPFQNPYFQQQFKIMPFIGVLNGKDMYLDDIVQTDSIFQRVDYNESLMCYGVRQFRGGATMGFDNKWEIVGNIYENPELTD